MNYSIVCICAVRRLLTGSHHCHLRHSTLIDWLPSILSVPFDVYRLAPIMAVCAIQHLSTGSHHGRLCHSTLVNWLPSILSAPFDAYRLAPINIARAVRRPSTGSHSLAPCQYNLPVDTHQLAPSNIFTVIPPLSMPPPNPICWSTLIDLLQSIYIDCTQHN